MHSHQRQQRYQPGRAIDQRDQGNAYHDGVGVRGCEGQHRGPAVKALQQKSAAKQQADRHKVSCHGFEVELLKVDAAHGLKQQRRREQQKHQVGQILNGRLANPAQSGGGKAGADQQNNGQQRGQHQ